MATKKVPLADVLWEAALRISHNNNFSCIIVKEAWSEMARREYEPAWDSAVLRPLIGMGCDPQSDRSSDLMEHTPDPSITRTLWLLLAMHVAEDEGIMVEVPA